MKEYEDKDIYDDEDDIIITSETEDEILLVLQKSNKSASVDDNLSTATS